MTFIVAQFEISIKRGNHFHGDEEMSTVRMHITLVGQSMESAHLSKPKRMFLALPVKTSMFRFSWGKNSVDTFATACFVVDGGSFSVHF